jgi:hypothetical protein
MRWCKGGENDGKMFSLEEEGVTIVLLVLRSYGISSPECNE